MYRGEREASDGLRRRRILGCLAIGGVFLAAFALNGWRAVPIWAVFATQQGTFAAGDPYGEWVYASCDGEEQQITVLRNGRLEGAGALDSLRQVRFPNWCDSLRTVDNPELADWQARLSELEALTASSASAEPILEAAARMPVSVLYLKPISDWIRDESHAASFLDAVAARPMALDHPSAAIARERRRDFSNLIGDALAVAVQGDVSPARLERWLASAQIAASGASLQALAHANSLTDRARVMVLERLDAVPPEQRNGVYMALAPDLVHDGVQAPLLVKQLRLLPRENRVAAARQMLARPDASTEFPRALLSRLREFNGPDAQLELYMTVAESLRDEPDAPLLLTGQLRRLNDMQRRMAATYLLGLDAPGETAFALAVIGKFADLHPLSQPKFIDALLQARQFGDRSVQEACLLAIQLQIRGPARNELLAAMLRHPGLEGQLHSRIAAELGSGGLRDRPPGFL